MDVAVRGQSIQGMWVETAGLDQSVRVLEAHKDEWASLPAARKAELLVQVRARLEEAADRWVEASIRAKGLDPESPWAGEEWMTGPWALAGALNGFVETLRAIEQGRLPPLKKITTRSDGRVVAQVYPNNLYERLLLNGISVEVWMQPGVTEANLGDHMAGFYRQKDRQGKVALILGAGNVNGIAPLDTLYRLVALGQTALLKMNPVNDYLGPILEDIFAPFVQAGYLRLAYGGADVGSYLAYHPGVDEIHMTGSARTHDAIVYGAGPEGAERKRSDRPLLAKPITSELSGISPTIVVPGRWSKADLRYQAEHVATMKLHNGGFNCVASQVLVLAEAWEQREEFLDALRQVMRELPPRKAYYPGTEERQSQALTAHPEAELLGGGDVPRTLIVGLDPGADEEPCFTEEFFGPVYAQTNLPGANATEYVRNVVRFCNEKLQGTLGATIVVHPDTMRELGPVLDEAIADLRYGSIGVNIWNAGAFLLPQATWGAYPGQTYQNIGSGIGVVHNTFLFDRPEKTVVRGSFYSFPRGWLHGDFSLLPKPPWFVTNRTAHLTAQRVTRFAIRPRFWQLPGVFLGALRG